MAISDEAERRFRVAIGHAASAKEYHDLLDATAGTATASTALIVDSSVNLTGMGKIQFTGCGTGTPAVAASAVIAGVGTSASPCTIATADAKFMEFRCSTTATSGDNRLLYMEYTLAGTGGGECLRVNTRVHANVATAHGAHFGLEFLNTAGTSECSGLGVACRGTLMIPNIASWAPTGTYAAGMFEIYSEGTNSDPAGMTELSVLRLCNSGHATGAADVDDDAFLLSIQGFTTPGTWTTGLTAATVNAACTTALRIKVGATTHWIPVATAIT